MAILRQLRLMRVADQGKFLLQVLKNRKENRTFKKAHPDIIFPPAYMLFESFQLNFEKYYEGGRQTAAWLQQLVSPYLAQGPLHILDWGCGPVRVLRHLPHSMGINHHYVGADYNPRTIAWCKTHFPEIQFECTQMKPPTALRTGTFDFIYGISVFTHLSEERHYQWRDELVRIATSDGIILLTTQGNAFLEKLTPSEQIRFNQGQLVVRANVKEGHRVFAAFHPPQWVRPFFENSFDILEHLPGHKQPWGIQQDTWILRVR